MIQAIFAMQPNGIMGNTKGTNYGLPWPHIAVDLNHFKDITKDAHIVMGSGTYESTPFLHGRIAHVITSRVDDYDSSSDKIAAPNVHFWQSMEECFAFLLNQVDRPPIVVIGGPTLLHNALKYVQKVHLSIIHTDYPGDIYAPNLRRYGFRSCDMLQSTIDPATRVRVDFYEMKRM